MLFAGRSTPTRLALVAIVATAALAAPSFASAGQVSATPSSLSSVFSAAQAGDTILLAPGDYGRFEGAMKAGNVTLKPQPGANVSMQLRFSPAQNITIDGLTLTDIVIGDKRTKNITVRNSDIPGGTVLRTSELDNANILFDHNVHRDWNKCDSCYEGRLELPGSDNQAQSGITIQNSEFTGGISDGIQNGARGVKILNNTFHNLIAGTPDGVHTDAIQLYGSRETTIRGNYFHDVGSKIMAPDGADHELIEDNVFAGDSYPYAIVLYSDTGSTIRHNTLAAGSACWFHSPCGIISMGSKTGGCLYPDSCDAGAGTTIEDNILADIGVSEGTSTYTARYNAYHERTSGGGPASSFGAPAFVGGAIPTTYAGYKLEAGSPGIASASDGSDRGARIAAGAPSSPPPATTPPPAAAPPAAAPGPPPALELPALPSLTVPPSGQLAGVPVLESIAAVRDTTAPRPRVRAVSTSLRSLSRSGVLRIRLGTTEPGAVVVAGSVRPGRPRRSASADNVGHARDAIDVPATVVSFATAGSRLIAIKIAAAGRRALAVSGSASIALRVVARDAAGNSASSRTNFRCDR